MLEAPRAKSLGKSGCLAPNIRAGMLRNGMQRSAKPGSGIAIPWERGWWGH